MIDQSKPNPRTAARWPVGCRVSVICSGWTGTIERVLGVTSGSGVVRVKWDEGVGNCFTPESSAIPNPDMNLRKIEE